MRKAALFRDALARFASGVTIITAKNKNKIFGITISSFTSLSLNPPEILFCLDAACGRARTFTRDSSFAVHILGERQKKFAQLFAARGGGGSADWQNIPHQLNADGVPVLMGALAVLFCHTRTVHRGGDHRIVVGSVDNILLEENGTRPLLYAQRTYHALGRRK